MCHKAVRRSLCGVALNTFQHYAFNGGKMKKQFLCLLAAASILFTGCGANSGNSKKTDTGNDKTSVSDEAPMIQGYERVWYDEFNGNELNENIWSYLPTEGEPSNGELQTYTENNTNVYVEDGNLVLKARKHGDGYTSGRIIADKGKDFTFGKVAVRAKVPEGKGLHTAVRLLPVDESVYGEWPRSGELDVMETIGSKTHSCFGTAVFGDPHTSKQGTCELAKSSFSSEFHEYTMEWNPGEISWYVDGNLYQKTDNWFTHSPGVEDPDFPAPFDKPFQLQLELSVGGAWAGEPNETTNMDNAEFVVDYVRVYQKHEYDLNVEKNVGIFRNADSTGNFIVNGNFSDSEKLDDQWYWVFDIFKGGSGKGSIADNTITITTYDEGTLDYSLQLVQAELPARKGKRYRFSFDAWADENRSMNVDVSAPDHSYTRYMEDVTVELTQTKQHYSFEYVMEKEDDPNARIEFNMGNFGSSANIYIQNVRYEQVN